MSEHDGYEKGTRVYVGGLSQGTKKEDLETEFEKFGKLNNVWVAFNPPGFAFIEFSNKTDAENACDNMNGTELLGGKLRVELSRSRGRGGFRGNGGRGRGGPRGVDGGGRFGGRGRGGSQFGGPGGRGGGGNPRGGFNMSRGFARGGRGRDGFGGNGNDYSGSNYGNGSAGYGSGRNGYDGGSGGSSRYRSRSPIGTATRGRRY